MFDNGMWQMPMFLLVASVFNIAFLVVAAKDAWRAHDGDTPQRHDGRIALLTMAVAELVWVLPCFVQCFLVWAGGNGHWKAFFSPLPAGGNYTLTFRCAEGCPARVFIEQHTRLLDVTFGDVVSWAPDFGARKHCRCRCRWQ